MFILLLFTLCRNNLKPLPFQSLLMSALHQRHINMLDQQKNKKQSNFKSDINTSIWCKKRGKHEKSYSIASFFKKKTVREYYKWKILFSLRTFADNTACTSLLARSCSFIRPIIESCCYGLVGCEWGLWNKQKQSFKSYLDVLLLHLLLSFSYIRCKSHWGFTYLIIKS